MRDEVYRWHHGQSAGQRSLQRPAGVPRRRDALSCQHVEHLEVLAYHRVDPSRAPTAPSIVDRSAGSCDVARCAPGVTPCGTSQVAAAPEEIVVAPILVPSTLTRCGRTRAPRSDAPVARQHVRAPPKETRVRYQVVLEQDRFVHLFEGPVDARRDPCRATQVDLRVVTPDLAGPVHARDQFANRAAEGRIRRAYAARGPSATTSKVLGRTTARIESNRRSFSGRLNTKRTTGPEQVVIDCAADTRSRDPRPAVRCTRKLSA